MNILNQIAESRKEDLSKLREIIRNFQALGLNPQDNKRSPLSVALSLRKEVGIIAEIKPASPSKGDLIPSQPLDNPLSPTLTNIAEIASRMVNGGALALSILTEPRKFKGSFGNLKAASETVPRDIPVLMKDFVIDETQLKLGKICGASNALLIASICDPLEMAKMMIDNGLEPLIEIHDREDLEKTRPLAQSGLKFVIGVNNRNLRDLSTSFTPTIELIPLIQEIFGANQPIISESGIFTRADMIRVEQTDRKSVV